MSETTPPEALPHPPEPAPANGSSWRNSISVRVAVIAILALLLLIPLSMVQSLIRERENRKLEAQQEVSDTWGGPQTVVGPVISVPYDTEIRVALSDGTGRTELRNVRQYAHFLPEMLQIDAEMDPEKRHRGIYDVVVYKGRLEMSGKFKPLGNNDLGLGDKLLWDQAIVVLGISDLRSIREQVRMTIGERDIAFEPGAPVDDVASVAVNAALPLSVEEIATDLPFRLSFQLNGSSYLRMVPIGRVTKASMRSTWAAPSFQGAFLPDSSNITDEGSSAQWTVLHLNRPYPQEFSGSRLHQLNESSFGVDLMLPVDEYRKSDRASKYGMMLIGLVFLVFFFVEVLQKMRIHPIQYLLVGLALCVFYTLLIALGEHIGFGKAYLVSTVAVVGLVVFYAASVFRMPRATRLLALVLLFVYGFMFTIIHQEDLALLIGSVGLFVVLAIVMALSRRIDWYNGRQ
ncbi:MAG: cell envelope integrity protein CreD [Flavobacteriales bacterium]